MPQVNNIVIIFTSKGAAQVQRNIAGVGAAAKRSASSLDSFSSALKAIVTVELLRRLGNTVDAFTLMRNRIRALTGETAQLNIVTEELFDIAKRTRTAVGANALLFQRLTIGTNDLGLSTDRVLGIVETLNKALRISGATTQEAFAGTIQLSQGFAAGALRGDELRSVMEQLPVIAQLIADEMEATRGELLKLGREGKITSDILVRAFENAGPRIAQQFENVQPTIGEAFVLLGNSLIRTIGQLGEATGGTEAFVRAVNATAEAVDQFRPDNIQNAVDIFSAGLRETVRQQGSLRTFLKLIAFDIESISELGRETFIDQKAAALDAYDKIRRENIKVTATTKEGNEILKSAVPILEELRDKRKDLEDEAKAGIFGLSVEQLRAEQTILKELNAETEQRVSITANELDVEFRATEAAEVRLKILKQTVIAERERALLEEQVAKLLAEKVLNEKQANDVLNGGKQTIGEIIELRRKEVAALRGTADQQAIANARLDAEHILLERDIPLHEDRAKALIMEFEAIEKTRIANEAYNRAIAAAGPSVEELRIQQQGINLAFADGSISLAEANKQLRELDANSGDIEDGLEGIRDAFLAVDISARQLGLAIGEIIISGIDQASTALADFALSGFRDVESLREAFANLFEDLSRQILALIIKTLILKSIQAALGDGGGAVGGIGAVVGAASGAATRQSGGFTEAGRPFLVGERGPELFTPLRSGRIVPNQQLEAAAPEITIQNVVVESEEKVLSVLESPAGQGMIMNVVRKNRRGVESVS